jgi:hypothetical protein
MLAISPRVTNKVVISRLLAISVAVSVSLVTSPAVAATSQAPRVGDCWVYPSYDSAVSPDVSPARQVACTAPHNAVTTSVGRVRGSVAKPWGSNAEAVIAASGLKCDIRGYTGQAALKLPMTRPLRVEGDWYLPSKAQWAKGQRWSRCDTIVPNGSTLENLPTDFAQWTADVTASSRCYDGNPAADSNALVRRCDGTEVWRAQAWIPIPGATFPGRKAIVKLATRECDPLAPRGKNWDASFPRATNWAMGYRGIMCLVGGDGTVQ